MTDLTALLGPTTGCRVFPSPVSRRFLFLLGMIANSSEILVSHSLFKSGIDGSVAVAKLLKLLSREIGEDKC